MKIEEIETSIGKISIQMRIGAEHLHPIIFLHGVYYDHNLWSYQINKIYDRTTIAIDMPLHGSSKSISKENWSLDDCASMLIEILDALNISKVIAIGHSWGSMTILRAAIKSPENFHSIGLCNMPFQSINKKVKVLFKLQHLMLPFRKFYVKQVAKALYSKDSLSNNPNLFGHLEKSMSNLSNKDVRQTDRAVIINAESAETLLQKLKVPALALKGKEDYVPAPPTIETKLVNGGHVSPLEVPDEVVNFIKSIIKIP